MPKLIHEMSNSWISFTPSVDWVRQMGVKKKKIHAGQQKDKDSCGPMSCNTEIVVRIVWMYDRYRKEYSVKNTK